MANKILIYSSRSLFTYVGESLDLFNPPDQSNQELYSSYFKFINSILSIYATTKSNGSIPVFWTKIDNADKLTRKPDESSTLRKLDNKQSYYIVLDDNVSLPLEVPSPLTLDQFSCSQNNINCTEKNQLLSNVSCCSFPVITDNNHQNIELTSNYVTGISIPISGLSPNKKYYYNITPLASNWPAKIYPSSGFIERNNPTDSKLQTSAKLELLFSYIDINASNNIPQSIINQDNKNIFTFLNLSISEENCQNNLLQDNINILCNDCLGELGSGVKICPELTFDEEMITASTEKTKIKLNYNNIDITKNNYFNISSESANWPISISNRSGVIIPQQIYTNVNNNKVYGSGSLFLDFTFNSTSSEPSVGWSNLNYSLDPNYRNKYIKKNIYAALNASIITETDCLTQTSKAIIICDDCLEADELSCINQANIVINETDINYYQLSQQRPDAESSVPLQCCDQDRHIDVNITNICPDEEYVFKFVTHPYVPITPISGVFTSSSNSFKMSALTNLNDLEATNIECIVTHKDTNDSVSDSMILRCAYCEWTKIKDLTEIYASQYVYTNLFQPAGLSSLIRPASFMASNTDSSSLIAAVPSGYLYVSSDNGINWENIKKHNRQIWSSVCLSQDTNDIYLTTGFINDTVPLFIGSGIIYKSTDNCNTLSTVSSAPSGAYFDIDVSNNGQFVIAAHATGIVLSSDYGSSWSTINVTGTGGIPLYRRWTNVSITNNGTKIAASHLHNTTILGQRITTVASSGRFLISNNGGLGWYEKSIPFETGRPVIVKYSKDGSTLAGMGIGGTTSDSKEYIYLSYDDGDSWYPRVYDSSAQVLNNLEISDDGSRLIIYGDNTIYRTRNNGVDWTKNILSSNNSDEIISIAHSSSMDILASLSQNNIAYTLHSYNCPSYKD